MYKRQAHALSQFVERCYARSIPVILVVGSRSVQRILERTGILDYLSNGFVAETTNDGLRQAAALLNRVACRDDECVYPVPGLAAPAASSGAGATRQPGAPADPVSYTHLRRKQCQHALHAAPCPARHINVTISG